MNGTPKPDGTDPVPGAVQTARMIAVTLLAGVLLFTAIVVGWWKLEETGLDWLALPAAILGLIAPVVGYRAFHGIRSRVPREADTQVRCDRFQKATVAALSVTEGAALLGIVAHMVSGDWPALTGVVTHVILTGAIWPSRARVDDFRGEDSPSRPIG
jgi:hypothetical protein